MAYEQRLMAAQLSGDWRELDLLLDDQLIYTGLSGELGGKQNDLDIYRSGRFRITKMRLLERQMQDLGSAVVVIALMDTAAELDGVSMGKVLRYTRVWALKEKVWRIVTAHISELAVSQQGDAGGKS